MLKKTLLILLASCQILAFAEKKPNVIVVLADDIGCGDISKYRRRHSDNIILETPNIDQLADEGMMFTQAHSPAALCAPSRYAIITGNSCYRSRAPWGVWGSYEKSPITDKDITLGQLMQNAGYHTAFLGKWHLGGDYMRLSKPDKVYRNPRVAPELDVDVTKIIDGPQQKGFDYSFTFPAGIQAVPYMAFENGEWYHWGKNSEITHITQKKMTPKSVKLDKAEGLGDSEWDPHQAGPLFVGKAVDYINRHADEEEPFFMYYCSQAVHLPHTPPVELDGIKIKGTTPTYHMDMIKELDVQMGMLVKTLKAKGVYDNTVFIFTSDNGGLTRPETLASGHSPSDIYRSGKNFMWEGGHRVPFIIRYPKVVKGGTSTNVPTLGLDIMATIAAITETEIPEGKAQDSYNLLPVLQQKEYAKSHDYLMLQSGTQKQVIIIEDGLKLIIQVDKKDKTDNTRKPLSLFDLNTNPTENESKNLINDPAYQDKIQELFEKYNSTRNSKMPTGS